MSSYRIALNVNISPFPLVMLVVFTEDMQEQDFPLVFHLTWRQIFVFEQQQLSEIVLYVIAKISLLVAIAPRGERLPNGYSQVFYVPGIVHKANA